MLHIAGVKNAWKRTTASPSGEYAFMIDLENSCCVCIHLATLSRTSYYFSGAEWGDLSMEAIHAVSSMHIIVVGQLEATRKFRVILAEIDHHRQLITSKDSLDTNLTHRIWDMQLGVYLSSFFCGKKICLIKHTTNTITKTSTDIIEIFRCSVENNKLVDKIMFYVKSPLGTWSLPFIFDDNLMLLDTKNGCIKAHKTKLLKKKTKIIACKGENGSLPRGMLASTVAIHDMKAWLTTCETREAARPIVLWSLDLQTWIWTEHPLIFPFGSHKPIKLRSLDIIPNGTAFMQGNCLETRCPHGGHLFSFQIAQLAQLGSGQEFDITPEGLKVPFQPMNSFDGCSPSAPPIDMDEDDDYTYATIGRATPQQPQSPAPRIKPEVPARPRQFASTVSNSTTSNSTASNSTVSIPPPVPAHRRTLTKQYQQAVEMGFSEPSLQRLIEKHQFKPFDSIEDMITALEAMTFAEEREAIYLEFIPPVKNDNPAASWLLDHNKNASSSTTSLSEFSDSSNNLPSGENRETKCIICWDAPASVLILPCKHFSFCGVCAKQINKKCPKCQGKVEGKIEGIYVG